MPRNTSKVSDEKPLEGAVLCCTSMLPEDRTQLAEWAQEMGAEHTLDLTSDVTHLLVGATDSRKYQYVAKEREDVKVLKPEWVQAVREIWMADQLLDLNALEAQYRVPTLFGLKICITGFEDLAFRNGLAEDIQKNGGTYTGDLTKDVTHLIAAAPVGKKFEYATMWQVRIVSIKWYKDTLDRGMQLDESFYHPAIQPEQQGIGAWNRRKPNSPKIGKRQREDQPTAELSRKLRRTASARFSNQNENMWNDIVGNNPGPDLVEDKDKVLRPTKSMPVMQPDQAENNDTARAPAPVHGDEERVVGILHGKHFSSRGFEEKRRALLYNALAGLGATVHDSMSRMLQQPNIDPQDRFLIVPYITDVKILAVLAQKRPDITLVTELWVEWCITAKQYVSPDQYVLGRPFSPIMLPAVSRLVVNASGFHQVQTMHISKIVSQLGAQYQETFTPETTVLVCNSANVNPQKIIHAQSWKVPIVTEKWLKQLATDGRIPSFEPFRVGQNQKAEVNSNAAVQDESVQWRKELAATEHLAEPRGEREIGIFGNDGNANAVQEDEAQRLTTDTKHALRAETHKPSEPLENNTNLTEEINSKSVQQGSPEQPSKSRPLQEISANILSKKPSPVKKKLFRQFDGHSSVLDETLLPQHEDAEELVIIADDYEENAVDLVLEPQPQPQIQSEEEKQNDLVNEFFEIKAAAAAKAAEMNRKQSSGQSKKKKLLGRALSNLSSSSRTSNDNGNNNGKDVGANGKQPLSRASSINSVNTDGLGVPLSNISRLSTAGINGNMSAPRTNNSTKTPTLKGNAGRNGKATAPQKPTDTANHINAQPSLTSFQAQLLAFTTSQPTRHASPPSRSQDQGQLTYADTAEATKLKAQLAEKRRARARLGQQPDDPMPELSKEESEERRQREWREMERIANERGMLKDDETLIGGGRRTRGRDKALAGLESRREGEDDWGAELLI